jgi:hypothetical protein
MSVACRCADPASDELSGDAAAEYVQHLVEIRHDGRSWETEYECPDTKVPWLLDYPQSEAHGGGPARLRRLGGIALDASRSQ